MNITMACCLLLPAPLQVVALLLHARWPRRARKTPRRGRRE